MDFTALGLTKMELLHLGAAIFLFPVAYRFVRKAHWVPAKIEKLLACAFVVLLNVGIEVGRGDDAQIGAPFFASVLVGSILAMFLYDAVTKPKAQREDAAADVELVLAAPLDTAKSRPIILVPPQPPGDPPK